MNKTTITIPFAVESGDGESRWIRLEQVEIPDEGVTMEQAAELVDEIYGINPCEDGLGNGGEATDEDALPEEKEFLDMARDKLSLDMCDEGASATWEAEVDVFRSHQDDGYSLQGERVEVGETMPMSKMVTETVEANGASIELAWPYADGITVSGAGATVRDVRGSTLNLAAPVRGRVRIRYRAVWDRVKITVRKGAAAGQGGGPLVGFAFVSGGSSQKRDSRENDGASVVAFWRDLAAECSLTRPPEDEQEIDAAEIERLCKGPDTDWHVAGECWQTVEKYDLCNCSGREAPDVESEDVDAPCPEGVRPGSFLGVVREFGEYVDCEGEDDEGLNDPEFYKAHCCEDNPRADLPRCRETREANRGGAEIESGPEHWKNIYGESVRLIAVTPEGGRCGETVKIWAVPDELLGPPVVPERLTVTSGQLFTVTVIYGGRAPFTWATPSGVTLTGTAAYGFMGVFQADSRFVGGVLVVTDACGRQAECRLQGTCREWIQVNINCSFIEHFECRICGSDAIPDKPYHRNNDLLINGYLSETFVNRYRQDPRFEKHCKHYLFSENEDFIIYGALEAVDLTDCMVVDRDYPPLHSGDWGGILFSDYNDFLPPGYFSEYEHDAQNEIDLHKYLNPGHEVRFLFNLERINARDC